MPEKGLILEAVRRILALYSMFLGAIQREYFKYQRSISSTIVSGGVPCKSTKSKGIK